MIDDWEDTEDRVEPFSLDVEVNSVVVVFSLLPDTTSLSLEVINNSEPGSDADNVITPLISGLCSLLEKEPETFYAEGLGDISMSSSDSIH